MCANSLRLIDKKKRVKLNKPKPEQSLYSQQPSEMKRSDNVLGAYWDPVLNNMSEWMPNQSMGTPASDESNQAAVTNYYEQMQSQSQTQFQFDAMKLVAPSTEDLTSITLTKKSSFDKTPEEFFASQNGGEIVDGTETSDTPEGMVPDYAYSFDPRLTRFDGFSSGAQIIPFSSNTASSVYFDMVFTGEKAVFGGDGGTGDGAKGSEINTDRPSAASDKVVAGDPKILDSVKQDANLYGTSSLMNPYSVTRLVGGLTMNDANSANMHSNMYDIRDNKRFYDRGINGEPIVEDTEDFSSINNPTVTNIIAWSNKDKWGRTPYSFQDFAFCKFWNVIPNNRLITLRKYAVPTYDNLNFPNMLNDDGTFPKDIKVAPIATVVTYFGGDSANKLNDFMKFVSGTKWKEIQADVHNVSGDQGSNPRAVIDQMFESTGTFGGVGAQNSMINKFLGKTGGLTGSFFSFAKFTGLLQPDGYDGHN